MDSHECDVDETTEHGAMGMPQVTSRRGRQLPGEDTVDDVV